MCSLLLLPVRRNKTILRRSVQRPGGSGQVEDNKDVKEDVLPYDGTP